jgi:hypothetical protein
MGNVGVCVRVRTSCVQVAGLENRQCETMREFESHPPAISISWIWEPSVAAVVATVREGCAASTANNLSPSSKQ